MMKLKINRVCIPAIILISVAFSGCLEEVADDVFASGPVLAINGLITNEAGPYYVRITKSNSTLTDFNQFDINGSSTLTSKEDRIVHEPVTDAIVIITDSEGNLDTMTLSPLQYNNAAQADTWGEFGFYETTTDMLGKPGNTYVLTVLYEGKEYTAVSTMPAVPPVIDKVDFDMKILTSGQPEPYPVPVISFDEPQDEVNFYRFAYWGGSNGTLYTESFNLLALIFDDVIILDDEFLGARVESLSLDAALVEGQGLDPFLGDSTAIYNYALEENIFDYYEDLQRQIRSDGGAFSPAPASPRSNFSNGALGIWQASAVSRRMVLSP
ncbi:DUF4249 family protein [Fulvivirgaceae bacterium BMA12]|uniref:DUF4249 family protein n=1 Tax=Agaribacillus aureus TaxID=3051825 RepID=A0ABT8L0X6_9BACT|nr:DUF4249 family protein [Fulvivirgaceae bacterium BMA12]